MDVYSRCLSGPNGGSLIYISSGAGHSHTNLGEESETEKKEEEKNESNETVLF